MFSVLSLFEYWAECSAFLSIDGKFWLEKGACGGLSFQCWSEIFEV